MTTGQLKYLYGRLMFLHILSKATRPRSQQYVSVTLDTHKLAIVIMFATVPRPRFPDVVKVSVESAFPVVWECGDHKGSCLDSSRAWVVQLVQFYFLVHRKLDDAQQQATPRS